MGAQRSSGNCKQSSNETISSSRDDISSSVLVTEFFSGNFQSTVNHLVSMGLQT